MLKLKRKNFKEPLTEHIEDEGLRFDPEGHKYFWNGKRVPSVSDIIKTCGLGKNYQENEKGQFYRDRGIACHLAIKFFIDGTLNESSIDDAVVPYYNQARKWVINSEAIRRNVVVVEKMYYSKIYGYAGTIDLIADKIYDWKCTKNVDPVTEIQGAMYKQLVLENTLNEMEFSAIQLDGSEGPAIPIHLGASLELVPAVMTLYRLWKRK